MRLAAAAAVAMTALLSAQDARELVSRDVYLMGTRASLSTFAETREAGRRTLEAALVVLEQAEAELSTWRDTSDISELNRQAVGTPWQASPAQCRMFQEVWRWHRESGGAFDPAIGRLLEAWDVHGEGAIPAADEARRALRRSGLNQLLFNGAACIVTKKADVTLDVGAFGKGEALDRAAAAMGGDSWMIDLGGQVSAGGAAPASGWAVAIADPLDRQTAHLEVRLSHGSLSTTGGAERDVIVEGRRVSHVLDPRTGEPAGFTGSVTVWHERGLIADILSTALYVMGPEDGMRWAEARGIATLYLIPDGTAVREAMTEAFRDAPGFSITGRE